VDPGTVITLRIRSFARPGEQTIAYLFRYDEQTRVLDRVVAVQPIEPVQVDADVRMFTERIQLMDNYESRIRKHVFRFKVHAMDRAILLLTCKHREQDLRVIDDLMDNWIVRGNKSFQFRWVHTHSPGIRLVRLSTARCSVVLAGVPDLRDVIVHSTRNTLTGSDFEFCAPDHVLQEA
ncbi:hypothetical protein PHET_05140, partial [Paragonimus heterotremus]